MGCLKSCMPKRINTEIKVMVIGSMPGEASLRQQQYYAHPRNNFWKYMAQIFEDISADDDYEARVAKLISHGVGLWDVMKRCSRKGSLDSDIQNVKVNDFAVLDTEAPNLEKLLFNGSKAFETFMKSENKLWAEKRGIVCEKMPSTSPANASQRDDDKFAKWREVLQTGASCASHGARASCASLTP